MTRELNNNRMYTLQKYICFALILTSFIFKTEAKNVLIVGSDTLLLNTLIERTNESAHKIIGIVPNYSFENRDGALENIPSSFRSKMTNEHIYMDNSMDCLIKQCDDVILLAKNGVLDFNSAVQIIQEKKNLMLEQPQKFDLSEIIILFALSQKYQVNIEVFLDDNFKYMNYLFDEQIDKVERSINGDITLISDNKRYIFIPGQGNTSGTMGEKIMLKVVSQIWDDNRNIHEREYLNFFNLIDAIEYCMHHRESQINLTERYVSAFDAAYTEMGKFN